MVQFFHTTYLANFDYYYNYSKNQPKKQPFSSVSRHKNEQKLIENHLIMIDSFNNKLFLFE